MSGRLPGYEGLEALGSFSGPEELAAYRASMLARSSEQADFIAARHPGGTVIEIGSGNGRLLIELARRGVTEVARGLDIARSRVEFARSWAHDAELPGLRFEEVDALDVGLELRAYGTAVCITGALGYFEPAAPGSVQRLLARLYEALVPGGALVLEIYPHPGYRRLLEATGGHARIWKELAPEDPWRFYLSELELIGGVLVHDKTFIHRSSGEVDSGRQERVLLYSPDELDRLLRTAGFVQLEHFGDWTGTQYGGGELLIVSARRAAGP